VIGWAAQAVATTPAALKITPIEKTIQVRGLAELITQAYVTLADQPDTSVHAVIEVDQIVCVATAGNSTRIFHADERVAVLVRPH
jgi:hypothetical protein